MKTPGNREGILNWLPFSLLVGILHLVARLLPGLLPSSWNDFHVETFFKVLATLGTVQLISSVITLYLRHRFGLVLASIASGIASSTMSTLLHSRRTRSLSPEMDRQEAVFFLGAYLGKLIQCTFIVFSALGLSALDHMWIFIVSALAVVLLIMVRQWRTADQVYETEASSPPKMFDLFKLAGFMLLLILTTQGLEHLFGKGALLGITAVASLFEMHGTIMANIQLSALGQINDRTLNLLFLVSLTSANFSKMGIVWFQGSRYFRSKVVAWLLILSVVQFLTWFFVTPE
jgi:uncharacterized membrane protein (DUF4010 family)